MCSLHFKNEFIEPHIQIHNRLSQAKHSQATLDLKKALIETNVKFKCESKNEAVADFKKSKTLKFMHYLYASPPKFKIKVAHINELENPLYKSIENVADSDFPKPFFQNDSNKIQVNFEERKYNLEEFKLSFREALNTDAFYKEASEKISESLSNVPVYIIINGQSEIVTAQPRLRGEKRAIMQNVANWFYDLVDVLPDPSRKCELGLFFMNYNDAENYLTNIIKGDVVGVSQVGVAIEAIGLDSAYKLWRGKHPGTDFRFVPSLEEIKVLLSPSRKILGNNITIVDEVQQQLCKNYNPGHFALSNYQKNSYFKGVPIYLVQLNKTPSSPITETLMIPPRFVDRILGMNESNCMMQGPIDGPLLNKKVENYIFFKYRDAEQFCKKHNRQIIRQNGSRLVGFEKVCKKPKIFISNFEDLIEYWEEALATKSSDTSTHKTLFDGIKLNFISAEVPPKRIKEPNKFQKTIAAKCRILKNNFVYFVLGLG